MDGFPGRLEVLANFKLAKLKDEICLGFRYGYIFNIDIDLLF